MEDIIATFLVPAYFLQVVVGMVILAWWFLSRKNKTLKTFGLGMAGYAAGLAAWTVLVFIKPDNLQPLIIAGAIPFLLAHLAYAKVAYKSLDFSKISPTLLMVVGIIVATFIVRTFLYPSEAYFSDDGLFFFGLHPVSMAFYIATISLTFLPAISAVATHLKQSSLKAVMRVGLTVLYINAIILVSSNEGTLLVINGVVMTVALLILWLKALTTSSKKI